MRLELISVVFLLVALTANAVSASSPPSCAHGPGYWCSSDAAARRCGAVEFCHQLRQRTSGESELQQNRWRQSGSAESLAPACRLCQAALSDAQRAVRAQKPEAEVSELIRARLPRGQLSPQTVEAIESLVDINLPETLLLLKSGSEPKQLCTLLRLCSQSDATASGQAKSATAAKFARHPILQLMQLKAPSRLQQKPLSSVSCQTCRTLVQDARQLVRDGQTQAEVAQLLKATVCQLPTKDSERVKCSNAIDKYLPIIFELLSTELDPIIVCQTLGACQQPQQKPQPSPSFQLSSRADPRCVLCEFVVREAEQRLDGDRSSSAIETTLNEVCSSLPQSARSPCNVQVHQLAPVVARLQADSRRRPLLACRAAGLCRRSATQRPLPPAKWMLAYD